MAKEIARKAEERAAEADSIPLAATVTDVHITVAETGEVIYTSTLHDMSRAGSLSFTALAVISGYYKEKCGGMPHLSGYNRPYLFGIGINRFLPVMVMDAAGCDDLICPADVWHTQPFTATHFTDPLEALVFYRTARKDIHFSSLLQFLGITGFSDSVADMSAVEQAALTEALVKKLHFT